MPNVMINKKKLNHINKINKQTKLYQTKVVAPPRSETGGDIVDTKR